MSTQQVQRQASADATAPFKIREMKLTTSYIQKKLAEFEAKYGLTSAEFYQMWIKGEGPDTKDTSLWGILYEILRDDLE